MVLVEMIERASIIRYGIDEPRCDAMDEGCSEHVVLTVRNGQGIVSRLSDLYLVSPGRSMYPTMRDTGTGISYKMDHGSSYLTGDKEPLVQSSGS